ncbi:hypothetical protein F5Y13DRAFT_53703 [Hypoxylon sp. FL1857]|nr:hypothetical protein F5Y13DRAFT_53703 [Hypoxylon sp. FL1857]
MEKKRSTRSSLYDAGEVLCQMRRCTAPILVAYWLFPFLWYVAERGTIDYVCIRVGLRPVEGGDGDRRVLVRRHPRPAVFWLCGLPGVCLRILSGSEFARFCVFVLQVWIPSERYIFRISSFELIVAGPRPFPRSSCNLGQDLREVAHTRGTL